MKTNAFYNLWLLSIFQRKHLPMFQALVDYSIAIEVGFHQKNGNPLTLKQLFLLDLAPTSTVQRRLKRLIDLGIIDKDTNPIDRRMIELKITPGADRLLRKYAQWIEQAEAPGKISVNEQMPTIPPITDGNVKIMFKLVSMRPDAHVCGTCVYWEGARAFQSGMFRFVEDSDGTCRMLTEKGVSFLNTLTPSTRQEDCDQWQSADQVNSDQIG